MKEQLIKFETAKLAKEKGFNLPCLAAYSEDNELDFAIDYTGELTLSIEDLNNNENNISYLAPTQALLQKWLRVIHDIVLLVGYFEYEDVEGEYYYEYNMYSDKLKESFEDDLIGETYEEALEQGLVEALKLIKP